VKRRRRAREGDRLPVIASRNECGVFAYPSRRDARRRKTHLPGMRPYECANCGLWHLGELPARVRHGDETATEHYRKRDGG
jgi:hypothetical protein